jgi:hypothetical protein
MVEAAEPKPSKRGPYKPRAVILTERTFPSSIVFCGLTGRIERWLLIRVNRSRSPVSYIQQVMRGLPERLKDGSEGQKFVPYFGEALGFVINYTPDEVLRCDLAGRPVAILEKAYRPGEIEIRIGRRPVPPSLLGRLHTLKRSGVW